MKINVKGLEFKFNVSVELNVGEISEVSKSAKEGRDFKRNASSEDIAKDVSAKAGLDFGISAEEYTGECNLSELADAITKLVKTNVSGKIKKQVQKQMTHTETEHVVDDRNAGPDDINASDKEVLDNINRIEREVREETVRFHNVDTGRISDKAPKNLKKSK